MNDELVKKLERVEEEYKLKINELFSLNRMRKNYRILLGIHPLLDPIYSKINPVYEI